MKVFIHFQSGRCSVILKIQGKLFSDIFDEL